VDVRAGVVYEEPLASRVPPVAAEYHSYEPPGAVAVNVAVLPVQIVTPGAVGAAGLGVTVTVTAVLGLVQPPTVV
jgi:hypothetical protein